MARALFYFDKECIDKALAAINETFNYFSDDYNILISLSHQPCPVKDGKQLICCKILSREKEFTASYYSDLDEQGKNVHYVSFWNDKAKEFEKEELVADILINYDWESAGVTGFEEANLSWEEECKAMGYGTAAERDNHFISMDEFNSMVKVIKEKEKNRVLFYFALFILTVFCCMYVFYLLGE